ncbi:MAG: glycosyltransferase family 2 protein [Prevotellaceae bacterium]|jgi:glycosyltransferase involved in cell wall biosynthesis|nr:glycosyltransferase family 2 protein [Prevotellaceae bacterium]
MKNDTLYIVMPAYNEEDNIQNVIAQWHPVVNRIGEGSRLVIFNDGSKDRTYEKMKALESQYPCLIAETKPNSGHGSTCLYAYRYALEHGAGYIFQTDSDGQTNPDEFWSFWEKRELYDFQTGYRKFREDGYSRVVVTKVLRMVIRLIFGENIIDANTPFRLMRSEKLKTVLEFIPDDFFLSNVLVSTIAVKRKERCAWHPITFKPRQAGNNSINLRKIIKIGLKSVSDFRKINRALKYKNKDS